MKDLILFGVQGSGKGTQARILAEKDGYLVFETGKELRALISDEGSELGKKIKEIVEAGDLVSDEVVIEIIENFLSSVDPGQSIVFDGIPRKLTQKDLFEKVMDKYERKPLAVLIHLDDEVSVRRLSNRWMSKSNGKIYPSKDAGLFECPEEDLYQRSDDVPEAIRTRLANYHAETRPVIDWYWEQGRLVEIIGDQSVEAVRSDLLEKIQKTS